MNFKNLINLLIIALVSSTLVLCSSTETKQPETEPVAENTEVEEPKTRSFDMNILDEINITLKEYRYPDGVRRRGFSYKKADVTKEDFNLWAKENVNFIKEALDKLPAEYAVQVIGHADSTGPEEAEGAKKGNAYYSQIRAEAVKTALVQQGIPAERIAIKAVGSAEPVSGYDEQDEINRRVTFQVIAVEPAEDSTVE
ncbi:OmpA family protein [Leptospira sp. GIMC2001]|uniref:OmpA family protein n=1 Tax=Leptospira sp. GIMC2001 TaxID=1513297 RepID=UPI00234951BE|nr:OmpA family protein [Leptospira sp. GIMC2001]WCL49217.1 OmpA family protein [Leptospira sp. GIMC2001]